MTYTLCLLTIILAIILLGGVRRLHQQQHYRDRAALLRSFAPVIATCVLGGLLAAGWLISMLLTPGINLDIALPPPRHSEVPLVGFGLCLIGAAISFFAERRWQR